MKIASPSIKINFRSMFKNKNSELLANLGKKKMLVYSMQTKHGPSLSRNICIQVTLKYFLYNLQRGNIL